MEQLLAKLLTSIVEGSITYGPYCCVVTYLWLSEREERRRSQKTIEALYVKFDVEKTTLTERIFKALNDAVNSGNANTIALNASLTTLATVRDLILGRGRPE